MTETPPEILAALDGIDASLDQIDPKARMSDTVQKVQQLAGALVTLGTLAERQPDSLSGDVVAKRRAAQARRLGAIIHQIAGLQIRWEARLSSGFEHRWSDLCIARSGLEFLIPLYDAFATGDIELPVDREILDDWDRLIAEQFVPFGGIAEESPNPAGQTG